MRDALWDYPGQEDEVIEVVRANPRQPGERPLGYIHRIAVLAGLMEDEDVVKRPKPDPEVPF